MAKHGDPILKYFLRSCVTMNHKLALGGEQDVFALYIIILRARAEKKVKTLLREIQIEKVSHR